MSSLDVERARGGLRGRLEVPGDKSISHRALLLAALAPGRSELHGLSEGEDVAHTAGAIAAFGAGLEVLGPDRLGVDGGSGRLHEPDGVIDVGNSGTGIRLLAGWAAARAGLTVLVGDDSVRSRPMERVVAPLRLMGADVDGRAGGKYAPLVIRGGSLSGIDYAPPVASAQVKGAVLLAALGASGPTTVREAVPTRRHSEELLEIFGARIRQEPGVIQVWPGTLAPARLDVPADPSQAAFWVVAATIVPGSDLLLPHVYVGPGRAGFIDVLTRMGADITLEAVVSGGSIADVRVRSATLRATHVGGAEVPTLIDEIPVLAVAAALGEGMTTFADAGELRFKETDRIATTVAALGNLGVGAEATGDGLVVRGGGGAPLQGGTVEAAGDHRIAMAAAVAGLASQTPVRILGWEAVATSYPRFERDLNQCRSQCE